MTKRCDRTMPRVPSARAFAVRTALSSRLIAGAVLVGGLFGLTAQPSHANLLAFYNFDTYNGTTLVDLSGNGNTGTLSASAPTLVTGSSAFEGGSYAFNGTNQFISLPVDINPGVRPQVTMGGWFRTSSTAIQSLLSHDNGGFDRTLDIDTRGGSGVRWSAFAASGVLGGSPVTADQWTFVAFRHDQSTGQLILDVDGAQFTQSSVFYGSGSTTMRIGSNPGFVEFLNGAADNVFLYDEVLNDTQIANIRQNGAAAFPGVSSAAPEPGTLALALLGIGCLAGTRRRRCS